MSKIFVDTDKINQELIPLASDEVTTLNNALSTAQAITFPDGNFGWSNIVSELSECSSLASKYNNWINRIQTDYNNKINDSVEDIASYKVEEVIKRMPIVK